VSAKKVIVVTGASDGIGAAAARRLHADGHTVVVAGRSPEKTRAVSAELGVDGYVADFTRLDDVARLAADLTAAYPRIDVLANNAGGMFGRIRRPWTASRRRSRSTTSHRSCSPSFCSTRSSRPGPR